jgi:hypothetical protein
MSGNVTRRPQPQSQHCETLIAPDKILKSICRSLVLNREDRYLRYPMPMESFYPDFVQLCLLLTSEGKSVNVNQKFQDWFHSVKMLQFHGTSLEHLIYRMQEKGTATVEDSFPKQDTSAKNTFFGRFFDIMDNMLLRMMTTCNGRIGMVSERTMEGDLICLLLGCSVPLVLRESERKGEFTLVGECYLDGCMNGEELEQDNVQEEIFYII